MFRTNVWPARARVHFVRSIDRGRTGVDRGLSWLEPLSHAALVHQGPASLAALAAVAFTGSLCFGAAAPHSAFPWLAWLSFVPLTLVARWMARGRTVRELWLVGWFGGWCSGLVGHGWLTAALEQFIGLPTAVGWVGTLVFGMWTAIPFGVWVVAVAKGPESGPWGLAWPIVVWLGLAAIWPTVFQYTIAVGFTAQPEWIQAAEIGGVGAVEAQIVGVGVLAADGMRAQGRNRWLCLGLAVVIPGASFAVGAWRMASIEAAQVGVPRIRVGLIQPNNPARTGKSARPDKMRRLREQSRLAQDEGAQLVVWPEAGNYPFTAPRPLARDFEQPDRKILARHSVPTIFGVLTREAGAPFKYNSAIVMGADGAVLGTYDKNVLFPLGEYIPLVDPLWARSHIKALSHHNAGDHPVRFEVGFEDRSIGVGPLICYEDVFSGYARKVVALEEGIDLLVNVTIDTWFGQDLPWGHLGHAQFRSVEHRVPLVRAVAAGPSSLVDATGRVVATTPARYPTSRQPIVAERLVVDVPLWRNTAQHPTPFSRGGWALRWLCAIVAAVTAGLAWRRRVVLRRELPA